MLLVHLFVCLVNCRRVAYLNRIPEGEIRIAAAPTPVLPQALSQYTCHSVWVIGPSIKLEGSIQSAMKSTKTYDLMVLLFLKSTTCSDNSIDHFPILLDES
jgi:hypothetical protein